MLTKEVSGRVYNYEYCIGARLGGPTGFAMPMGMKLGPGESLYVVSRGQEFVLNYGVTKCTLDHQLLWEDRSPSFAKGQAVWLSSIDLDSQENVYISDEHACLTFIFDKDGNFLGQWGKKGSGDGELSGPSGLAFDKEDNLFIVDTRNNRIQKFTRDGKFLGKWGKPGGGEGEFNMPWGIAVDSQGFVYVADWKNHRVQKFSPVGDYLASFGRPGKGDGELHCPTSVAIDKDGDVYVTDWGNDRLNIYTSEGVFITAFLGDADQLSPWGQAFVDANPDTKRGRRRADLTEETFFKRPIVVSVDNEGRIAVLECETSRIQIYLKEQDYVYPQFNL